MASKIKNIIIFTVIAALLILVYIFFIKPAPEQQNLISSPVAGTTLPNTDTTDQNSLIARNFLSLLLSVKSIKLDDSIFSSPDFINLHDSSILLIPPVDEGRPNPFAPIGSDITVIPPTPITPPATTITPPINPEPMTPAPITPPTCTLPQILDTITNTCITPPPICTSPKILDIKSNTCITPVTCKLPKVLDKSTNTCVTLTP